jgi:deoxyribodipyrimidine photolyase-related protein
VTSPFRSALAALQPASPVKRVWHYLPYDQLSSHFLTVPPSEAGVVLIESAAKAARRPYHKQKLAYVLANQRHFALELAGLGVSIRYVQTDVGYAEALLPITRELGPLCLAIPAERELRSELATLVKEGALVLHAHAGWLTTDADWEAAFGDRAAWKMDTFYRRVRERTGLLMQRGKRGLEPEGGRFSFDVENRRPWSGEPAAPEVPRFEPDAITREVGALIEAKFAAHPGRLDLTTLPATHADAERLWAWAMHECLPLFGPFEDAMSTKSRGLFHTRISPLLNLHRLWPERIVKDVATMKAPIESREGFVRQILGWREFVHHVHVHTDGFRDLAPTAKHAGDGGWAHAMGHAWPGTVHAEGGALPSLLGADQDVPPALWGKPSGLACLDEVVRSVWDEGYSHHITRLMVIGNLMTLLGVSPRALADWFWVAYIDAYDWVVEPNVLAMATYGDARMTTKPYVSGAPYLNTMSDYCGRCSFDPKKTCPVTRMYWAFISDHEARLGSNPRTSTPVSALRKRAPEKRGEDLAIRAHVRLQLARGERVDVDAGDLFKGGR